MAKLTDPIVKALPPPERGNKITYDAEVKGFGVRVTASGAKAFVLNYTTTRGRERRFTIGAFPEWKVAVARDEATRLKRDIDTGGDPLAELQTLRSAPTVADMCRDFIEQHLPKKRPATARDYKALIDKNILPALGREKVADIRFTDIDALHRAITKRAPYAANRTIAVLSKMFSFAIKKEWRSDNPARGIERNTEQPRHRYLTPDELQRFTVALGGLKDQQAANIFRLLLLTGARRGEVQSMRWADIDLASEVWTKPASSTKQNRMHRLPLNGPTLVLLRALPQEGEYVFPGRGGDGHRVEIKAQWAAVLRAAGITDLRIHDLRHSHASLLAGAGLSLPIIGALLGHSSPSTTANYAHLMDDPLRAATEKVGNLVAPLRVVK